MDDSPKSRLQKTIADLNENATNEQLHRAVSAYFEENAEKEGATGFWKSTFGRKLFVLSLFSSLSSIFLILLDWHLDTCLCTPKWWELLIYCIWLIGPPLWFLGEYALIYRNKYLLSSNQFADFKYTQELANKIWAAMIVLITALLYLKYHMHL